MPLPSAMTEEVICPEQVVVTRDDDGTVHMLLYAGEHLPDRYVVLKHVILTGRHAGIVDTRSRPEDS